MRALVDENMPVQVVPMLVAAGHEAVHVDRAGLKGVSNGDLLGRAVADGWDVLLTGDTKMAGSQELSRFDVAVVVIHGRKTPRRLPAMLPDIFAGIASTVRGEATTARPGGTSADAG